jgi:hypothetical protein
MFVAGSEDFELAEADMKGWADKGAVRVPHYYDINAAAQCGLDNERIFRSYRILTEFTANMSEKKLSILIEL